VLAAAEPEVGQIKLGVEALHVQPGADPGEPRGVKAGKWMRRERITNAW
jgi:hypothetical protein